MPEIKKTEATFHGREVIQVDGFFFVSSNSGPIVPEQEDDWLTESHRAFIHDNRLYVRQDVTPEAYEYFGFTV